MARYFIYISYKGTSYHGWQLQPNSVTVQKILEETLTLLFGEEVKTTGAGRTDTGVHATVFCAHFDSTFPDLENDKNLVHRINRFLPPDISVSCIRKVTSDANARYSAVSRTYKYYVSRIKDPFSNDSSWYVHPYIDVDLMNKASGILLNHADFTSFSRLHSGNKTNICRVLSAGWEQEDNRLIFTIKADRFLRNMVRAIVGSMIRVGTGKMSLEDFEEVIQAKDRSRAGTSAPARGLFLADIEYPGELFV